MVIKNMGNREMKGASWQARPDNPAEAVPAVQQRAENKAEVPDEPGPGAGISCGKQKIAQTRFKEITAQR